MSKFKPRLEQEIIPDLVSSIISKTSLTDINSGSVLLTILEAVAAEDSELYMQMNELILLNSLDNLTGEDLVKRAAEFDIVPFAAKKTTGFVTIRDTSITKVAVDFSSDFPAVSAGATKIYTAKTTSFPATGSVILGRGTSNVETLAYTSIDNINAFYSVFNLNTGTSNPHDNTETVILSQGGARIIPSGTIVRVPPSDNSEEVTYVTKNVATILDGEKDVLSVPIEAVVAGSSGNAPANLIKEFENLPFSTATVFNPLTLTNGIDAETDREIIDRIKATIQSASRGTKKAIELAAIGTELDNQRVVSAKLIETPIVAGVGKLYIDDGAGFTPKQQGIGIESVVSAATGGEQFLQIDNYPIVQKIYINNRNNKIDFDEGTGELNITLTSGVYTLPNLFAEIKSKMETAGNNTYTISSLGSEKIQITGSSEFDLLWKTGTNGLDNGIRNVGSVLGFNVGSDDVNSAVFIADYQPTIVQMIKNKRTLTDTITLTNGATTATGITESEVKVGDYIKNINDDDSAWNRIASLSPVTLSWNYEGAGGAGSVEKVNFLNTSHYSLNRFVGEFELNTPLLSGESIAIGDLSFRSESESDAEDFVLNADSSLSNNAVFTQGSTAVTGTDLDDDVEVGDYIKLDADTGGGLTGTLNFTQGSTTVTGSGTSFTAELAVNDFIKLNADKKTKFMRVASIESNTSLTLQAGYQGSSDSGAASNSDPWVLVDAVTPTEITLNWAYAGVGGAAGASSVCTTNDLIIKIDGGELQTITFLPNDFSTLGVATAIEVVDRIANDLSGGASIVSPQTIDDKVKILSNKYGTNGSVQVLGGSANSELNFSTNVFFGVDGYQYETGLVQEVQHKIDGFTSKNYDQVRAAGTQIEVLTPTVIQQTFSISIIPVESVTIDMLISEVRSAVAKYVNSLKIGDDVILSEIIDRIQDIAGIFDLNIISPSANVAIGDSELARVQDQNISVA